MKNLNINPMGLKGKEINERMIELMGIKPINENKYNSSIELTKIGPDNKSYAIVRENHEYFIKVSDKTSNLIVEDFKYIGGLQNKKSEAYESYAKAIKHLNLNFKSLAEAYGKGGNINVFENDNLLSENAIAGGFSQYGGNGFSGEGNLEGNKPMFEEEIGIDDNDDDDDDELSEVEKAVDSMLTTEIRGPWSTNHNNDDDMVNKNIEKFDDNDDDGNLSIQSSIDKIDEMIDYMRSSLKKKL